MSMRRSDREVKSIESVHDILTRCDTLRLGMNGGKGYPYVIPMTFGSELKDGKIIIYLHAAGAGRKWDILTSDPRVCVEADLYYQVKRTEDGGITANYESVIGTGIAEQLTSQADKLAALKIILAHYKESGFPVSSCSGMSKVAIFRIVLDEVSGKANI